MTSIANRLLLMRFRHQLVFLILCLLAMARSTAAGGARTSATDTRTFHLAFDAGLVAQAQGDSVPLERQGKRHVVAGVDGRASRFEPGAALFYASAGNLEKAQGTISFWFQGPLAGRPSGDQPWTLFSEEGPDTAGSTRLTIQWFPGRFIRAGIKDPKDTYLYFRALETLKPDEWHHLVLTWNADKGAFLYMDGRPVATGWMPAWTPKTFERFSIGAAGTASAHGDGITLDEFSIYDRELTIHEVRQAFQAYRHYPAEVAVLDPFISADAAAILSVAMRNPGDRVIRLRDLEYVLADGEGVPVQRDDLPDQSLKAGEKRHLEVPIGPTAAGDYTLHLKYREDGELRENRTEVMSMMEADIVSARPAAKTLLAEVDVSRQEPLAEVGGTHLVASEWGNYLEGGPVANDRFALDFTIEDVDELHVAVITYPDDKARTMEVMLQDFGEPVDFQVHTGVFTGEEYPLSNELREHRVVFWPRTARQAFIFMTAEDGYPAAVHGIKIYRLRQFAVAPRRGEYENEVPSRSIGLYYEDPVLFHSFGTGRDREGFMEATDRLVQYMRSFGQTEFEYPLAWYGGTLYGTTVEPFEPDIEGGQGGVRPHPPGFPRYLLKRLGEADMTFVAGMHLHTLPSLNQYAVTDWEQIAFGDDTVINVNKEGELWYGHWHGADPNYNPADPRVMSAVNRIVEEIAARYGQEPAFGGISLVMARPKLFTFGSIESGYNDSNLQRFQDASGITIPVYDRKDPDRFSASYQWLMANADAKEAWIDWRCQVLYDHYASMAERLASVRGDLKLTLNVFVHLTQNARLADYLGSAPVEAMREMGIDPSLYRDHPNIVFNPTSVPADFRWARNHGYQAPDEVFRTVMTAPEVMAPTTDHGRMRMTIHDRYFESAIGAQEPLAGLSEIGVEEMVWRASTFNPSGFHSLEAYVLALNHLDVVSMVKGGYVIGTFGMERDLEAFSRAFRALPAVRFEDLSSVKDPLRIRQQIVDGRLYFYALNTIPAPLEAVVKLEKGGDVTEPATGRVHPNAANLSLSLAPYELRTFVSASAAERVVGAEVAVSNAWRNDLERRFRALLKAAESTEAKADEYAAYLELARQTWDRERYSRLYFLLQEHWVRDVLEAGGH